MKAGGGSRHCGSDERLAGRPAGARTCQAGAPRGLRGEKVVEPMAHGLLGQDRQPLQGRHVVPHPARAEAQIGEELSVVGHVPFCILEQVGELLALKGGQRFGVEPLRPFALVQSIDDGASGDLAESADQSAMNRAAHGHRRRRRWPGRGARGARLVHRWHRMLVAPGEMRGPSRSPSRTARSSDPAAVVTVSSSRWRARRYTKSKLPT